MIASSSLEKCCNRVPEGEYKKKPIIVVPSVCPCFRMLIKRPNKNYLFGYINSSLNNTNKR
jgi:hypothetical protein